MRLATNSYKMRIALTAVLFTAMMPGWAEEDSDSAKPQQVTSNPPSSEAACPTITNKSADKSTIDAVNGVCANAKKGDAESQANMATVYLGDGAPDQIKPLGIAGDTRQVVLWMTASAENGFPGAQYLLGVFYAQGKYGLKKDLKQAAMWLVKAAKNGDKDAQELLGKMRGSDSKSDDAGSDE